MQGPILNFSDSSGNSDGLIFFNKLIVFWLIVILFKSGIIEEISLIIPELKSLHSYDA